MHYANIKYTDIANGEGIRTSLFVSGCRHHCKNCFNEIAWNFNYGNEFTTDVEDEIIKSLEPSYIKGITLLGGEPLEKENQRGLINLIKKIKAKYGDSKSIWCYTGFVLERDLLNDSRARCEVTDELLSYVDVLVDGPFVEALKDISLKFRGSSNQRIIDMKKTLSNKEVVLYIE